MSSHLNNNPVNMLNFSGSKKLPIIQQTETAECGLACLAMIAAYYGYNTSLIDLRQRFSISTHGTTLKTLYDWSAKLNLSGRALKLEIEELSQLQLPCILHWDMNHFVVLKSISKRKICIHDPAIGERLYTENEFSSHFTGVALELFPTEKFEAKDDKRRIKLNQLWSRMVGLKRSLTQILVISFILQLFSIISPFYMQAIVDDVLLRNDKNLLLVLAFGFGLLMVVNVLTNAFRDYLVIHLSNKLSLQMATNLFQHLIRLPLDYFEKRHIGDVISRFSSIDEIKELFCTGIVSALVDGVMAILILAMMYIYSVKLTIIVLIFLFLYAFLRFSTYNVFKKLAESNLISDAKLHSNFIETIRSVQSIKIFQRENDRINLWQNRYVESMNIDINIDRWGIVFSIASGILFGLENIIVIYIAANSVIENVITLGMLYAFMSYKSQFTGKMESLISQWIEFQMLGLHLERISDITFTKTESEPQSVNLIKQDIYGSLSIQDISFRYAESEKNIFSKLSFEVKEGESIAIIGESGCGKTTLLKCLMGLFQVNNGKVLVDGEDIKKVVNYRNKIAAVMQDDHLLSGSIAENIAFFDPQIDMDWVQECAKSAGIHDEICHMAMEYNTLIGEMGASLSGGQKQRILLARALYRKPKILFLDEATSNLDINNESIINRNIKNLNITRIIVAHRPQTINTADRVINISSSIISKN
ncbi:peptidase domain-containing ABC transporter [Vibrio fluvialis]|uniref:peptidase domain-containing ABC transporter n=1 Tax=Vibrio fluvialis TaxID=676 RepID=UPI00215D4A73|nr:peptidase domain-containing ABC transporter [Vibrio fluvialis]MCR9297890.1 peptidase domain-containing ABC transporter [Vibrio fluvialis]